MSKLEREIVSFAGDHRRINLGSAEPIAFGLSLDEIERRIIQAYMRHVFRSGNASASRTVYVTRLGFLEVQIAEMPSQILAPGMPLFMLEVFSLPSHSSVDSYGLFDLDETELAAATEFVLEAEREVENRAAAALH